MPRTSNALDYIDVMRLINKSVAASGGMRAFAARCKITPQYLSLVIHAARPIPEIILREAGIRRYVTTHYEIVEQEQSRAA